MARALHVIAVSGWWGFGISFNWEITEYIHIHFLLVIIIRPIVTRNYQKKSHINFHAICVVHMYRRIVPGTLKRVVKPS